MTTLVQCRVGSCELPAGHNGRHIGVRKPRTVRPISPGDGDRAHGTTYGYKLGCRCTECRAARSREYRKRRDS